MAMTINTNVASLNAQRNLSLSGGALATSMQRLSSGLRVNSAKDDAAGLAIAERMNAQAKGLAVAARNANDGISLAQTAEGALGKVGDMLQRMRELAVQSSNATNSDADRKALQAEVSQLTAEIDRVAKTSSFNGKNLLDGSFAGGLFQVGSQAGDNITVGALVNTKASNIGKVDYAQTEHSPINTDLETVTGLGTVVGVPTSGAANSWTTSAEEVDGSVSFSVTGADGAETFYNLGEFKAASTVEERAGELVSRINNFTADTGVTAFLEENESGALSVKLLSAETWVNDDGDVETATVAFGDAVSEENFGVAGDTLALGADQLVTGNDREALSSLDVSTQSGAWKAMKQIDSAIDQVNAARGDLGALQTRFEKTVENIDIMNENVSAARGRIVDTDFASETANLSRTQILQQAGTAMVAQANQLTQNVLSLLR